MSDPGVRHAAVAVPVPVRRLFTYSVGPELGNDLRRGARVRVPFGGRRVIGTVVEWPAPPPEAGLRVKAVEAVVHGDRRLTPELLALTRFVADYYLCSWGEAIEAALPPDPGRVAGVRRARLRPDADPETLPARAPARRRLVERLRAAGGALDVARLTRAERRVLSALCELGWVEIEELAARGGPEPRPPRAPLRPPHPTEEQAAALAALDAALDAADFRPFVLFGATGSGKTEVYLRAAERCLARGRGVLYLVPEIGLTPLLRGTIDRRFPGQAVVLHSGLGRRERYAAWQRVRAGDCRFVVGTRSAVFAPLERLGLIVVDEEQDGSYKQGETPRYNGRDVAIVRAREAGALIVLGSATPSMESFRHARAGRYGLLRLGGRIERRPLAQVQIVDMRREFRRESAVSPLSRALARELRGCLERHEQALVLRNRRGWAVALHCPTCGGRVQCARCAITMTWHRAERRLRCHYCGFEQPYPDCCPDCGAESLNELGEGTERIEELLRRELPSARIERMDRDTVRGRGAQERMLRRFDRGEIDVLVGTQMIAKGHDFPRVTLVGVLSADQALGIPDFRAAERAFQLLTQVAGRAGRGQRPGRVVVQAFDPEHPVLGLAAAQDYEAFFEREIRYRRALRYPPVSALVQVLVQDSDEVRARSWAGRVAEAVRRVGGERLLLAGPGPAPIERLKGRWRQQILIRSAGRRRLVEAVDRALAAVEGEVPRRALVVDVDPLALL